MPKKPKISQATQQKLKDAFWSLYAEKSIDKISIREITERAGYNRGTFYLYYKNVHDILAQIEAELMDDIRSLYHKKDLRAVIQDKQQLELLVAEVMDVCSRQKKYINVLFGQHGDPSFVMALKQSIKDCLKTAQNDCFQDQAIMQDYYLEYHVSGLLWLVGEWIRREDLPIEQFFAIILYILAPETYDQMCRPLDRL